MPVSEVNLSVSLRVAKHLTGVDTDTQLMSICLISRNAVQSIKSNTPTWATIIKVCDGLDILPSDFISMGEK